MSQWNPNDPYEYVQMLRGLCPKSDALAKLDVEGEAFLSQPRPLPKTKLLSWLKGVGRFWPKQCFNNARDVALWAVIKPPPAPVEYWEGYAVHGSVGFPLHHAWNTIGGVLLDVTWDNEGAMPYGEIPSGWAYYGARVDLAVLKEHDPNGLKTPLGLIGD